MAARGLMAALIGGAAGAAALRRPHRHASRLAPVRGQSARVGTGLVLGMVAGTLADTLARWPRPIARLAQLMPPPATHATWRQVVISPRRMSCSPRAAAAPISRPGCPRWTAS